MNLKHFCLNGNNAYTGHMLPQMLKEVLTVFILGENSVTMEMYFCVNESAFESLSMSQGQGPQLISPASYSNIGKKNIAEVEH